MVYAVYPVYEVTDKAHKYHVPGEHIHVCVTDCHSVELSVS